MAVGVTGGVARRLRSGREMRLRDAALYFERMFLDVAGSRALKARGRGTLRGAPTGREAREYGGRFVRDEPVIAARVIIIARR